MGTLTWRGAAMTEAASAQRDFKLQRVTGNWCEEINPELLFEFCLK